MCVCVYVCVCMFAYACIEQISFEGFINFERRDFGYIGCAQLLREIEVDRIAGSDRAINLANKQ